MIARTSATAAAPPDPRFLALSSSLDRDRALLREDVLGSMAHVLCLGRAGLLTTEETRALHGGLQQLLGEPPYLPDEEDIHMAIEALLRQRLGAVADRLHTGRSRNDQIALTLRLHLREATRRAGLQLLELLGVLLGLADVHARSLMPGYTHRQRAIPITVAHWALASAAALLRDGDLLRFNLEGLDRCPLYAGALAGTSLPLDRAYAAALLGFAAPTDNSLDTVGDRDGSADFCYLSARLHGHLSRLCTDLIDFATQEFGFLRLDDAIACGSSMMPHKKNPDVFELVRGRSARALGDLSTCLTITRGLPLGYQRDLQEDRGVLTSVGEHLRGSLELVTLGLRHVSFDTAALERALGEDPDPPAGAAGGVLWATDLAEVLVLHGVSFREAYRMVGGLVLRARRGELDVLGALPPELLQNGALLAELSRRMDPRACVEARALPGGPAPAATARQTEEARARLLRLQEDLNAIPSLEQLRERLQGMV